MNEITKQQLLELSHDYVIAWHDVQTHRNGMTHDNLDSSIIVIKMSNIFVGDYRIAADRLLTCPFVELLSSEYAHDIYDILRALNEPYGTSTSLSDEYIDTDEESHYDDQLRLGLFYVIAAAIQVSMLNMTEISKNELLELSNDFINDWHDVQAHRQRMTDDNLDSSIVVIKMSNIFVGDYHVAADRLLTCPFVEFISTKYAKDLADILRVLTKLYTTSTSLSNEFIDTDGEISDGDQLRLAVIYVIAAAIQVCSNPERFSHDGVAQGLLKPIILNKYALKHAKALASAVSSEKHLNNRDPFTIIVEALSGRAYGEGLAPVHKNTVRVIREITLISNHVFINSNNRTQGRFSADAIHRILKILNHIGYLDRAIKVRQINNIQGKLKNDKSKPLTFNQMDIDWNF